LKWANTGHLGTQLGDLIKFTLPFYEGKYANKKEGIVNCDATPVLPAAVFK
jgi:hypothetical protein